LASNDHGLIKRLVFKLVKKHIAGSTSASVIRTVKQLNDRNISATVTFLNENAATPLKIRYNINSYIEMIKQLSRLNLEAEVSLRLSQLGYLSSKEQAINALDEIVSTADKYKKRLWIESESAIIQNSIFDARDRYDGTADVGVEVPADYMARYTNGTIPKPMLSYKYVKLMTLAQQEPEAAPKKKEKSKKDSQEALYYKCIAKLAENDVNTIVFGHDEKILSKIMAGSKNYKKHLRFEVPLGYNRKRFGMMLKSNQKMSVYVAYGKDWVPYAINKLTEGRIRDIAKAVLDGESGGK
jgi:proline dehydrogenase